MRIVLLILLLIGSSMSQHIRFGVIADPQWGDANMLKDAPTYQGPVRDLDYEFSTIEDNLAVAFQDFKNRDVDFIITLGDLIEHHYDEHLSNLIMRPSGVWSGTPFSNVYQSAFNSSNLPVDNTHNTYDIADIYYGDPNTPTETEENALNASERYLHFVLGNHDVIRNSGTFEHDASDAIAAFNMGKLNGGTGYYFFDRAGYRFIILKSTDGADKSAVSSKQLTWLSSRLDEADKNNLDVVIFAHHGVEQVQTDAGANITNAAEVYNEINNHPSVVAYMFGHTHAALKWKEKNNKYFFNFDDMIGPKNVYYTVDITAHKLIIKTLGDVHEEIIINRKNYKTPTCLY